MSDFEPSDWKRTRVPGLSQLDSLMRCSICKDFLKAPVITSCNHTFCSQCIRQHLMNESSCPLCKVELFESNLKRVIVLEELVASFQSAREDLIVVLTQPEPERSEPNEPYLKKEAEREVRKEDQGSSTRHFEQEATPSESSDVEIIEVLSPKRKIENQVSCPVCNKSMSAEHLQSKHLDYCLNGESDPTLVKASSPKRKRTEISSFFQRDKRKKPEPVDHEKFYFEQAHKHNHEAKRIPKLDFTSTNTTKLKEKLAALKLATHGTRPQMELRYNQFYLLSNANLDSNHPQSDLELRQRLKQWEASHSAFSAPAKNAIFGDSHKSLTDKNFSATEWLAKYKDEFRDLVQSARRSARKSKKADAEAKEESKSVKTEEERNMEESENREESAVKMEEKSSETEETVKMEENFPIKTEDFSEKSEESPAAKEADGAQGISLPDADTDAGAFDFSRSVLFPH